MRVLVILVLVCGCVGCDQATKAIAREQLHTGTTVSFLYGTLLFERTQNTGAFLSLGQSLPKDLREAFFTLGGLLVIGAGVFWAIASRKLNSLQTVGIAIACGGGLSNITDRMAHGYVIDFLNIGVGSIRTGIFNVADIALMIGMALLIVSSVRVQQTRHQGTGAPPTLR